MLRGGRPAGTTAVLPFKLHIYSKYVYILHKKYIYISINIYISYLYIYLEGPRVRLRGSDGRHPRFRLPRPVGTPALEIFGRVGPNLDARLREKVEGVVRLQHRVVHHGHDPVVEEQPSVANRRRHGVPQVLPHGVGKLLLVQLYLGEVARTDFLVFLSRLSAPQARTNERNAQQHGNRY